ncbi:MAG TPA: hypothetical protein VMU48_21225 [Terracidiphilus sp.]|nr:hypothetical protein [Terracidiphilus sp.]
MNDDGAGLGRCQPPEQQATNGIDAALAVWMDAVRLMGSLDAEFANELAACHDPVGAVEVCNRWTTHRLDSLFALQCRVLEIWFDLTSRVMLDSAVAAFGRGHDDTTPQGA